MEWDGSIPFYSIPYFPKRLESLLKKGNPFHSIPLRTSGRCPPHHAVVHGAVLVSTRVVWIIERRASILQPSGHPHERSLVSLDLKRSDFDLLRHVSVR